MAICKNCGSGIPEGAKFCTKCGKQAEVSAPVAILPQTDVKAGKNAKMPPVFFLIIIVVGIVAVLAFILLGSQQPITACKEDWVCSSWSSCSEGIQTRTCRDIYSCGTGLSKPEEVKQCGDLPPSCIESWVCGEWSGCVNGKQTRTCTDIYSCGTGLSKPEETQECEAGPGDEPTDRTLVVNVFKEPLPFMNESTFKEKGYVIVRYFWSDTCPPCFSPVNIESELEILAGEFKDLMVLSIIDVDEYKQEASKYAKIGGFVYTPFIRVEGDGKHGYVNWFGNNLRDKLSDLKYETAQEVCRRTDLCHYDDSGKLHKDF